jgi:hypothetical protein
MFSVKAVCKRSKKLMLKKLPPLAFVLISILAYSLLGAHARPVPQHSGLAFEGIGIDTIKLGTSSRKDVIAFYGEDFKLIAHNEYSYEMIYKSGISFYYCYRDTAEKIFLVEILPSSKVSTSKGIIVGESTLADVFNLYGEIELSNTADDGVLAAQYDGVHFLIDTNLKKEKGQISTEKPETLLPLKIILMDIVPPKVSCDFCKEFDQRDESFVIEEGTSNP